MANFDFEFKGLLKLEFSNPKDALHYNKTENGYTYMGIYEKANPNWYGWKIIKKELIKNDYDMQNTSEALYQNDELTKFVKKIYKEAYWDKAKLDYVLDGRVARLIFLYGVNVGMSRAIKSAQKIVGIKPDGVVGRKTIEALNDTLLLEFEPKYKQAQINYYNEIVKRNPAKEIFLKGWLNRVKNS